MAKKKSPNQKYQNIHLSSIIKDTPSTLISMTSQIFLKLSKNHLNLNQRDLSSQWNNSNVTFHHKSWDLPLWSNFYDITNLFQKEKKPFLKAAEIPKPKKIQFCKQKSHFTSILTDTLQKTKNIFINNSLLLLMIEPYFCLVIFHPVMCIYFCTV